MVVGAGERRRRKLCRPQQRRREEKGEGKDGEGFDGASCGWKGRQDDIMRGVLPHAQRGRWMFSLNISRQRSTQTRYQSRLQPDNGRRQQGREAA